MARSGSDEAIQEGLPLMPLLDRRGRSRGLAVTMKGFVNNLIGNGVAEHPMPYMILLMIFFLLAMMTMCMMV